MCVMIRKEFYVCTEENDEALHQNPPIIPTTNNYWTLRMVDALDLQALLVTRNVKDPST
jgi:hypothetical protein